MKTAIWSTAVVVVLALSYFLLWPVPEPVAWTPPPAPKLEGVYAYNEKLKGVQRLLDGVGIGPETIAVDAAARVYTGYADGRVVQVNRHGATYSELMNTGGRPLGIAFGPNGGVLVADARRGLLLIGKKLLELSTQADGVPYGFANDVDNSRWSKNVYFSDASSKFGYGRHMDDLLEHGANGRLIRYNVETQETAVLLKDLHFANGVALGPNEDYVLVNETSEYRVTRYWLKGEKAGQKDVFIDNLPGFPDDITFNGRDRFWLALVAPRDPLLDALLLKPGLRKVVSRLPHFLQPKPGKHAFVLGLNLDGQVIANLQYAGSDAYAPITSVREAGSWLYFGSLTEDAIGRLPLNQFIAGAPMPPPGWQQVPASRKAVPRKNWKGEEEEEKN